MLQGVNIKALIFDFDGTILDTETPEFQAWTELYLEHDQTLDVQLWGLGVGTWGAFDPIAHLEELTGQTFDHAVIHARIRPRVLELIHASKLLPGVIETLDQAKALGLRVGLASSSGNEWIYGWLKHYLLTDRFEVIKTRDDVKAVKPDPELYVVAAEALNLEPGVCAAIEDSPNGAKAALAAGMHAIAVPNQITQHLEFPKGVHRISSLEIPLASILEGLKSWI
jgi:HAD superfamily hydrolase (TIGR01509 family)